MNINLALLFFYLQKMEKQNVTMNYQQKLFVVAIEVGFFKSRYAFSSLFAFNSDPLNISTRLWTTMDYSLKKKTPTKLLLNPDQTFHSFGCDAENNFTYLEAKGESKDYFYFNSFDKIKVHSKDIYTESLLLIRAISCESSSKTIKSMCTSYPVKALL